MVVAGRVLESVWKGRKIVAKRKVNADENCQVDIGGLFGIKKRKNFNTPAKEWAKMFGFLPENHRFVQPIRSKPFNLFNMENVITQVGEPTNYASFGRRLVALIIDGIIIGVAQSFIIVPIMISLGLGVASKIDTDSLETMEPGEAMSIFSAMMGAGLMIQLVSWGISGV